MDTFAIKSCSFNICPYCGGSTEIDIEVNNNKHEEICKKLEKLYEKAN